MAEPAGTRLPLSAAQRGIWTGQLLEPGSPAFNTAEYVEIRGPVLVDELVAAIRLVVGETEALGVRFESVDGGGDGGGDGDGGPWQVLGAVPAWEVPVADLDGRPDPLAEALRWMDADLARPVNLDLGRDPVFGHAVFRLGPERYLWYHRVHHIALDGYGLGLVARRVAEVYTALATGGEPGACQFGSLRSVVDEDLAYRRSPRFELDRDYWVAHAAGRPEPVTLAGRSGPLPHTVLRRAGHLERGSVDALAAAARGVRAVWTDAFTAAFAAYLHRMTGAGEVNIALPVMARIGSAALRVPCMVLNVVPVRVPVGRGAGLAELTALVAGEIRAGRPHHRYRHEQLRRDLRLVASENKLFGPSVNLMPFDYGLRFAGHPGLVRNVSATCSPPASCVRSSGLSPPSSAIPTAPSASPTALTPSPDAPFHVQPADRGAWRPPTTFSPLNVENGANKPRPAR